MWTMERWCTYIYSARIDFAIQNALALTTLIDREHNGVSGNELFPRSVVDARGARKGRRGQGTSSIPFSLYSELVRESPPALYRGCLAVSYATIAPTRSLARCRRWRGAVRYLEYASFGSNQFNALGTCEPARSILADRRIFLSRSGAALKGIAVADRKHVYVFERRPRCLRGDTKATTSRRLFGVERRREKKGNKVSSGLPFFVCARREDAWISRAMFDVSCRSRTLVTSKVGDWILFG